MAKLVRDNIPSIIRSSGGSCETERLSDTEFRWELKKKLVEEANEVLNSSPKDIVSEIVDVLEVVDALMSAYRIEDEVRTEKEIKGIHKGRFENKVLLKGVITDETSKRPSL